MIVAAFRFSNSYMKFPSMIAVSNLLHFSLRCLLYRLIVHLLITKHYWRITARTWTRYTRFRQHRCIALWSEHTRTRISAHPDSRVDHKTQLNLINANLLIFSCVEFWRCVTGRVLSYVDLLQRALRAVPDRKIDFDLNHASFRALITASAEFWRYTKFCITLVLHSRK